MASDKESRIGRLVTRRVFVMQLAGMGFAAGSLLSGCAQQLENGVASSSMSDGEFEQIPSDHSESYSGK